MTCDIWIVFLHLFCFSCKRFYYSWYGRPMNFFIPLNENASHSSFLSPLDHLIMTWQCIFLSLYLGRHVIYKFQILRWFSPCTNKMSWVSNHSLVLNLSLITCTRLTMFLCVSNRAHRQLFHGIMDYICNLEAKTWCMYLKPNLQSFGDLCRFAWLQAPMIHFCGKLFKYLLFGMLFLSTSFWTY